MYTDALKVLQ
jgi:tetratricopeptide repeat protein 30